MKGIILYGMIAITTIMSTTLIASKESQRSTKENCERIAELCKSVGTHPSMPPAGMAASAVCYQAAQLCTKIEENKELDKQASSKPSGK